MKMPLKSWRLAREKSADEMAKMLGIARSTYCDWEKEPANISIKAGKLIAEFLEVPFDDIIFLP